MTIQEIAKTLTEDNPSAKIADIAMYASNFHCYYEATININQNGVIVAHPRTGQPMENPYVKIRNGVSNTLKKTRLKTDRLWKEAALCE